MTLPRKSKLIRPTPTMHVLLPLQHHVPFDTDEANDAGGVADVPAMFYRLMDR